MIELSKISEEVVSTSLDQIKWCEVMWVDPRDYTVSECNARKHDRDRSLEGLEASILEIGFRFPLLSDETKKIIDGSRRHTIALKHGLMIPVIHIDYSKDSRDPLVLKSVDSILANMQELNLPEELGETIKAATASGTPLSKIAEMLGIRWSVINSWSQSIAMPKDVDPPSSQSEENKRRWYELPPRKRAIIQLIKNSINSSPKEKADLATKLDRYEMMADNDPEIVKLLNSNNKDQKISIAGTIKIYLTVPIETKRQFKIKLHSSHLKSDRFMDIVIKKWLSGEIELTKDDCNRY